MKFLLLLSLSAFGYAPIKMVSLGNSLSAGSFAGDDGGFSTKTIARRKISWWDKFLFGLTSWEKYSFATGTSHRVYSHLQRLRAISDNVTPFSLATPGDQIEDVARYQLAELEKIDFDYLILEVGANDVAARTPVDEFEKWVRFIMSEITAGPKEKQIVIVPVPDIPQLIVLKDKKSFFGFKCSTIWKWSGVGDMFVDPKEAELSRELIHEYNKILKKYAVGPNVYYAKRAENMKFEPSYVSRLECFHLNYKGQNALAEATWPF